MCYVNSTNQHAKNECQFTTLHDKSYVFCHFQARSNFEYETKCIQFVTIYHILKYGCPITNYESMKESFDFLQVPKSLWTSLKWHKCLDNGWMHARTCAHKNTFNYSITKIPFYVCWWNHYYGLPKVDFCSCVCGFVHVYVVEGWKHIPILLTLEQVLSSVIVDNLTNVIMASLLYSMEGFFKLVWLPN